MKGTVIRAQLLIGIGVLLALASPFNTAEAIAPMENYCIQPPFLNEIVPPNILVVLDMSERMQCPAYLPYQARDASNGASWDGNYLKCAPMVSDSLAPATSEQNYNPRLNYYGYFDSEGYFYYSNGRYYSVPEGATGNPLDDARCAGLQGNFVCSADWTTGCFGNDAICEPPMGPGGVCVERSAMGTFTADPARACISGNLLNWAASSRVDVLKNVIIGGKGTPVVGASHTLISDGGQWAFTDFDSNCRYSMQGNHQLAVTQCGYLTVASNGTQITGNSDSFHYIYQRLKGDFDVRVRVKSVTGGSGAKTGVMVRTAQKDPNTGLLVGELEPGAAFVQMSISRAAGFEFMTRGVPNQNTDNDIESRSIDPTIRPDCWLHPDDHGTLGCPGAAPLPGTDPSSPIWLRLVRSGGKFTAYYSRNPGDADTNWTQYGKAGYTVGGLNPPDEVVVGMSYAAYDGGARHTAEIGDFQCKTCGSGASTITPDRFLDGVFNAPSAIWQTAQIGGSVGTQVERCEGFSGPGCTAMEPAMPVTGKIWGPTVPDIYVDRPKREITGLMGELGDRNQDFKWDDPEARADDPAPLARFAIMEFNGRDGGLILNGFDSTDLSAFQTTFNNIDTGIGSPEMLAAIEAMDYYRQVDSGGEPNNTYVKGIGTAQDPFYQKIGGSLISVPCRKSFVLLISDGYWEDQALGEDPVPPVHFTHTNDLRPDFDGIQKIDWYSVAAFGPPGGDRAMQQIAMYGGFDDLDTNGWPYDRVGPPVPNSMAPAHSLPQDPCNKAGVYDTLCAEWDKKEPFGLPDNYFKASAGGDIKRQILNAIQDMLKKAASGTAVSVLASGEGQGANMLQAVFFPKRDFGTGVITELSWVGMMQNLWYFLDPLFNNSNIREDTGGFGNLRELRLDQDLIVELGFDEGAGKTVAKLYADADGDGEKDTPDTPVKTIPFEDLSKLWEAGIGLTPSTLNPGAGIMPTTPRQIWTTVDGISGDPSSTPLSVGTVSAAELDLEENPGAPVPLSADAQADQVLRYAYGIDNGRDVQPYHIGVCSTSPTTFCEEDDNCPPDPASGGAGTCTPARNRSYEDPPGFLRTWRLGDIVRSTPRVQSHAAARNDFDEKYNDKTYAQFVDLPDYGIPGMVYMGANDGMLHAIRLGELTIPTPVEQRQDPSLKARIDLTGAGMEEWAYVPKGALPYLKYLADPDYCHLYYVDMSHYLFDASFKGAANADKDVSSWGTVLIGGMRLGGACVDATKVCDNSNTVDTNGDGSIDDLDCVQTPAADVGFSSYFALDVTHPDKPKLLWEFSDPDMGFSSTGPVIFRENVACPADPAGKLCNGDWFVVIPSGPTGPIDRLTHEFKGASSQTLKLFVLDMRSGSLLKTIDTGMDRAFGGVSLNTNLDLDLDYQDDVGYITYTADADGDDVWGEGGILRLIPFTWDWSHLVANTGPITASPNFLRNKRKGSADSNGFDAGSLWLYFGEGRYFYKRDDTEPGRRISGVKDPCYLGDPDDPLTFVDTIDPACTTAATTILDVTGGGLTEDVAKKADGWFINLDCFEGKDCPGANATPKGYFSERLITNPTPVPSGGVFFTTFAPTAELCGTGGLSYLWGINWMTGGGAPVPSLLGKGLLQLSTGEIKEINLADIFDPGKSPDGSSYDTETKMNRKSAAFRGVPPQGEGFAVVVPPDPVQRILFLQER